MFDLHSENWMYALIKMGLDSLEVAGHISVRLLLFLLLLAFGLRVLSGQSAVTLHVVAVGWLLVALGVLEADIVDLWVTFCGHL